MPGCVSIAVSVAVSVAVSATGSQQPPSDGRSGLSVSANAADRGAGAQEASGDEARSPEPVLDQSGDVQDQSVDNAAVGTDDQPDTSGDQTATPDEAAATGDGSDPQQQTTTDSAGTAE